MSDDAVQRYKQSVQPRPNDSDLLVPFEQRNITGDYREYYTIKRNNFFATIQKCPDLWELFCKNDEIWKQEVSDLEVAHDNNHALPLTLYFNAHAKIRVSMELAFSQCMQEARSVLRDAVECVAHAHHMLRDPANVQAWKDKHQPGGQKAFEAAFKKNKRNVLFRGIEELHEKYCQLSEAGSHPTWMSLANRLATKKADGIRVMSLYYTGMPDQALFVKELFSRLLTCIVMERTFFEDFKIRLHLDARLMRVRDDFARFKEQVRSEIIARYNIASPTPSI